MKLISVIGVGMGNPDNITVEASKAVTAADVVVGSQRLIKDMGFDDGKNVHYEFRPDKIKQYIDNCEYTNIAVVFNGDISLFSGGMALLDMLDDKLYDVRVYQGISSVSYFASKLGINWGNSKIINVKSKSDSIVSAVRRNRFVFALANDNVSDICSRLLVCGLGDVQVYVGERLSHKNENITAGYAKEFIDADFDSQSILFIENPYADSSAAAGLDNDEYINGSFKMLNKEARAVVLSQLGIKPNDICYDIGAGNGSMAVEMALAAYCGNVYAIEWNALGTQLIIDNSEKFHTENISIVKGKAPDVLRDLPKPDAVFIGGSGGFLNAIFKAVVEKGDDIRIAAAVYTLEDLSKAVELFSSGLLQNIEIKQLSVTNISSKHGLTGFVPQTPVFIISGIKEDIY